MEMTRLVLAIIYSSACLTFADRNTDMQNLGISLNMYFVGTVDGKSFFAGETLGNWTTAQTFCNDSNMEMASITSKEQLDMLIAAHDSEKFDDGHWLCARVAMDVSQFAWEKDNSVVDPSFIILYRRPKMLQCLYIHVASTESHVGAVNCDYTHQKILCQIVH